MNNARLRAHRGHSTVQRLSRLIFAASGVALLAACGGGGGGETAPETSPGTPPVVRDIASYQGNYSATVDRLKVSLSVSPEGTVVCVGGGLPVCRGQVTAAGAFVIEGNDGLTPTDTVATLTGSIDGSGNIAGTFTLSSATAGSASGVLTGTPTSPPAVAPVAKYQGIYQVSGSDINASLTVDPAGAVTCSIPGLTTCAGQVSGAGTFAVTANTGTGSGNSTAALSGSVNSDGTITGTYTVNSVANGTVSGVLTGQPATLPNAAPATSSAALFQGNYSVAGGDARVDLVVDRTGLINCTGNALVVCAGQVNADGTFTISGNDGLSPVDTTATLTGVIDGNGRVTGRFVATSVSEGTATGDLTGQRTGAVDPPAGVRSLVAISIVPDSVAIQGTPTSATMTTSQTGCVSALGTYSDGTTDDVTSTVVWTSSQPSFATVPSEASGSCALITGYIVDLGVDQTPEYPLGLASGSSRITARDPKTGREAHLVLNVERDINEGTADLPLRLGGTVSFLRPAIDNRNSYVSTLDGSHYAVLVKPLSLYSVRISGNTAPLSMFAGPKGAECFSTRDLEIGQMGCIARSDEQGRLPISVITLVTLSSPETFKMYVQQANEDLLVSLGSASSPRNISPGGIGSATVIGVGPVGCSYYSVASGAGSHSLTFRSLSAPATISVTTESGKIYGSDTYDLFDVNFLVEGDGKPLKVKYCANNGNLFNYDGSTAGLTVP